MAPWVVGGPGRCGKTLLVNMLWNNPGPVAGFPLEGLFSVYLNRWIPFFRSQQKAVLEEYLLRPRYIDASRCNAEKPVKYFKSALQDVTAELPTSISHQIPLVNWALARFATENGRQTWASFDLHPELIYPRLRRLIPKLKLVVMVRDPREAIGATMYWRGNLQPDNDRDRRFKLGLIMWCLGVQTGQRLANAHPNDVFILDFNALVAGDTLACQCAADLLGLKEQVVRNAFAFEPDFDYDPTQGFVMPDGQRRKLFLDNELREISVLTRHLHHRVDKRPHDPPLTRPRWRLILFTRTVLVISRMSPLLARRIAQIVYFPRQSLVGWLNDVKRFISDLRIGVRCYCNAIQRPFRG